MVRRDCQAHACQTGTIKAANAGAVMSKLLQVSLGWVYLEDGTTLNLDNDRRNKTLVDLIDVDRPEGDRVRPLQARAGRDQEGP